MRLREWLAVRGPAYTYRRGRRLVDRYGLRPVEAMKRVEDCVSALAQHGCAPTLPTPGRVVQRYPQWLRSLQDQGAEIAVHSHDHLDLAAYPPAEAHRQLLKAAEVCARHGIEVFGFRCPYLSYTDEMVETLPNGIFDYSSNKAIRWEAVPDRDAHHTPQGVVVLERLYQPARAEDAVCTPSMRAHLVEIPVCLPDDLELVDGLHLDADGLAKVWVDVLYRTHRRGEFFDLLFHPELARQCKEPMVEVLRKAAELRPQVWIARLCDISAWWREKASFSTTVADTPEGLQVSFACSDRATILVKGMKASSPQQPWSGEYRELPARELHLTGGTRPFVGLAANAPGRIVSFLREQGYILDTGETAARCATYIDAAALDKLTSEVELVNLVESSPGPLVRYWRWPHAARSAMCVSGDLDALTLFDYASRLFVR